MIAVCATPTRFCYSIYGVHVTSELPLPFYAQAEEQGVARAAAAVTFVDGNDDDFILFPRASMSGEEFVFEEAGDATSYLRWPHLYEFAVAADGSRVACRALDGCDVSVLQNFLFGQVLAVALVRQGVEPLHAAVVRIGDGAVALLGDCTFGKSTLLATFAEAGHRVLTDDVLILRVHGGAMYALPGSGRIKLLPDAASRFIANPDRGAPLTPMTTKRSFAVDEARLERSAVPLRALFALPDPDDRDAMTTITIRPMSRADAVCTLVKNTFTTHVVDRERLARQFDWASQIASRVDAFHLEYPTGLHHLEQIQQAIVTHVAERMTAAAFEEQR